MLRPYLERGQITERCETVTHKSGMGGGVGGGGGGRDRQTERQSHRDFLKNTLLLNNLYLLLQGVQYLQGLQYTGFFFLLSQS